MDFKNLLSLALEASNGRDNYVKGAVGFEGYGFLFQDLKRILR